MSVINTPNLLPALPEIALLGLGCFTLLVDVFVKQGKSRWLTYSLVQLTLVIVGVLVLMQIGEPRVLSFHGMFVQDPLAVLLKAFICLMGILTFLYSRRYIPEWGMPAGEYYVLGLFSILGMMVLVSGAHFLTLFLGLELFSLPIYAMVALNRESPTCSEAAMKYFVIGAMASGMLLYGLSMLYGATHSLDIYQVAQVVAKISLSHNLILVFGLVFVVVGLGFKLGMVPFHMWVPDVYEGAPSSVTLLISAAPKVAGLALVLRLLTEATPALHVHWQQMLIVLAVLSMAIGNITAIVQTNLKRMLAYSSIAHMGYMSLGLIAASANGYGAATFYMITYGIMALGAFGMIVILSKASHPMEAIDDFKGLNSRNPWLAFIMMLLMFSMAGIPPIVGFMAKVGVLEALIRVHLFWLAVVALLFAVVGVYYYIRVVKVMYFDEPGIAAPLTCPLDMRVAITLNGLAVLGLGLFPDALMHWCHQVF